MKHTRIRAELYRQQYRIDWLKVFVWLVFPALSWWAVAAGVMAALWGW